MGILNASNISLFFPTTSLKIAPSLNIVCSIKFNLANIFESESYGKLIPLILVFLIRCLNINPMEHLRQRSGIGWFGRVKEFFLGSSLSNKQALDFQQFIQDLKLFDIDNVEKSNFFEENDKKKGFGFNQDIFNQE